jgi:hypothetical protein
MLVYMIWGVVPLNQHLGCKWNVIDINSWISANRLCYVTQKYIYNLYVLYTMVCEILLSLDGGVFLNVSGIVVNTILRNMKPGSEYTFL